jgi:hypothetical protein
MASLSASCNFQRRIPGASPQSVQCRPGARVEAHFRFLIKREYLFNTCHFSRWLIRQTSFFPGGSRRRTGEKREPRATLGHRSSVFHSLGRIPRRCSAYFPFGQQSAGLLSAWLDGVWWDSRHERTSSHRGASRGSPMMECPVPALQVSALRTYWRELLGHLPVWTAR